jgi:uncharacterized iron-regulated protein
MASLSRRNTGFFASWPLRGLFLAIISGLFVTFPALAQTPEQLLSRGLQPVTLTEALAEVRAGDIVVLGEEHGTTVQPQQQLKVMEQLRAQGLRVSVGMEFFDETQQDLVEAWRAGKLSEADFLKAIHWSGFPFSSYREQALFPREGDGFILALNAPRALTGRISQVGVAGLSKDEKAFLPPQWTLGNEAYFERFKKVMSGEGHLPDPASLQKYFEAQSTWDEVMAFNATQFIKVHPEQVLVIVVGEFHVQYGGGLPDRLRARGASEVKTFSLLNLHGMTTEEQRIAVEPDAKDGARADFVWTSDFL